MDGSSPWARDAAALPIAFAQVREDPRLDVELCGRFLSSNRGGTKVVMIASGGDTAACLARMPLARLVIVDVNPAQIALTRCKLDLARRASREDALRWLGHVPMAQRDREGQLAETFGQLGLRGDALGAIEKVAALGPDHAGRYEVCFSELRAAIANAGALSEFLDSSSTDEAAAMIAPGTPLGGALDAAFASVMSLPNLVALFGRDATQNPRQSFASHFAGRVRAAAACFPPCTNPFLWQMLDGKFPDGITSDWLAPEAWAQRPRVDPEYMQATMLDALSSLDAASFDVVHLSNILDWLSVEDANRILIAAHGALRPGGATIIRQLNSSLDIPSLESGFRWDYEAGRDAAARDRSFFYPQIHIGFRE